MNRKRILLVVSGYAVASVLYIVFSDTIVFRVWPDLHDSYMLGVAKGIGFVAITSAVLYVLLRRIRGEEHERYRQLFDNHHAVMLVIDPESGAILDANAAAAAFYGWPRDRLRRMRIQEINTQSVEKIRTDMNLALSDARNRFYFRHRLASGETRNVVVHAGPVERDDRRLLLSIVHDDTPRIEAENALRRINRVYKMLSQSNELIVRTQDRDALLEGVCRIAVDAGGFRFAWIGWSQADGTVRPIARAGDDGGYVDTVRIVLDAGSERGRGPTAEVFRHGTPVVINDFLADPSTQAWHDAATRVGIGASAAFPIRQAGQIVGTFNLYAAEKDFFAAEETATLAEIANDIAFGLENIERETDRARLLESLERSEARWRYALDGAEHGVWEWNTQTGAVFYSAQWKSMLGYDEAGIGNTLQDWESRVHPDDLAAVKQALHRHLSGETPFYRTEHRLRCSDGTYKWVLGQGKVMTRTAAGEPLTVIGTHTDVTERHEAEAALKASEARYRRLFMDNPQPMWVYDEETLRFLAVNDAAVLHYGYSETEFLAMTILDIRPQEDASRLRTHVEQIRGRVMERAGVWRHRKKDGTLLNVEISSHAIDFAGHRARIVHAHDITKRLRAERERKAAEAKFRGLVEQSLVGVFQIDAESILYANPRAEEIYGYGRGELNGTPFLPLIAEKDRGAVLTELRKVLLHETAVGRIDFEGCRKDGTRIMVGAQGILAQVEGRDVVIGVMQDITEKLMAEQRIHDYAALLERAVLGTANAISQMVELRDPYTAGHERRVADIAVALAAEMGLDDNTQRGLRLAGIVHDVGKITVPAEILSKPGRLTAIEFELVKGHAEQGYQVLKDVDFPWPVAEIAYQHHERMDGSGYPRGLKGDAISIEARIVAVADVVESMGSHRPYRAALGIEAALTEIEQNAGRLYDPVVAAACLRLFREKGYRLPA